MVDYISREAAIDFIDAGHLVNPNEPRWSDNEVVNFLRKRPAADVQPVRHGRFIGTEYDGCADGSPVYYEWKCSECGCIFEDEEPTFNFCPNCGADMRGEQNDDIGHIE